MCATEITVIEFLYELFSHDHSYSSLNTARSALSTILWNDNGLTIGKYPSIKRFLKGVFETRPPLPRYNATWDVNIVLCYLKNFFPLENVTLAQLTHKLVTLLALVTAQRAQTLSLFNTKYLVVDHEKCLFYIRENLKNSSSRVPVPIIPINRFDDQSLCPIFHLEEYLKRTQEIRKSERLFVSLNKPHDPVSVDTISRWIKKTLYESGIDTDIFKGHSSRSAAVSAANLNGTDIHTILKTAGWSNSKMFAKFYNKPVQFDCFTENDLVRGQRNLL